MSSGVDVSAILQDHRNGDADALPLLIPIVYDQLHRLAAQHFRRERQGHSLQPTAIVNEAYLRLVKAEVAYENRVHFFGVASRLMRQILVEHARRRDAAKRGGLQQRITLDDRLVVAPQEEVDLVALDDALQLLATLDDRQSKIVELRYFGGLSVDETAEVLGISPRQVKRDWSSARLFLQREITRKSV